MSDLNTFPSVDLLVPHSEPMILVDKIIHADDTTVHCQVFVTAQSQFFNKEEKSIGAWVGIEYMAQTISAWSGYQSFLKKETSPIGFLLGTRRYHSTSTLFNEGDVLDIYAEKLMESEGMGAFYCSIKCQNNELANAQLNVFVPNNEQLETMLKGKKE
ncbi:hotdog family protein [Psychromonas sp.]|nr:hotdog family protein [Psychromonas sp.]